jgi:hypothetical protein
LSTSGFIIKREQEFPSCVLVIGSQILGKEMSMSPYEIVVVMILSVLFIVISIIPLLPGQSDLDVSRRVSRTKKKAIH